MFNYNCNRPCRLCNRSIISQSVTIVTVNGVDTLVVDIPRATYMNKTPYCITIAQPIPTAATLAMPVAISIGGVTTTVYPLTTRNCIQVMASQIQSHTRYKTCVQTNGTSGVFKALDVLPCAMIAVLPSLPVVTPAAPTTPTVAAVERSAAVKSAKPKTADSVKISANTVTVNKEAK